MFSFIRKMRLHGGLGSAFTPVVCDKAKAELDRKFQEEHNRLASLGKYDKNKRCPTRFSQ